MRVLGGKCEERIVLMVYLVNLVPFRTGVGHAMAPEREEVIEGKGESHL